MRFLMLVLTLVSLAQPALAQAQGPRCSASKNYPLGRWETSAASESAAKFSTFITFTQPTGGTWLPASGTGTFSASPAPTPGAEVIITLWPDAGGPYKSTNRLVVSADGCRMIGTFIDTEGHRGEARYRWNGQR
jgi:hypothetical protein